MKKKNHTTNNHNYGTESCKWTGWMIYLKHQWVQILAARVRGPAEGPYYVWGQSTKLFVEFFIDNADFVGCKV